MNEPQAGPELNDRMAKEVMCWTQTEGMYGRMWWGNPDGNHQLWMVEAFCPSTDIAAAWQVVERMQQQGWGMAHIMFWQFSSVARGHNVQFYRAVYPPKYGEGPWEEGDKGRSFPLAVCRAALAAVERDTDRARSRHEQTTSPGGARRVVQR